MIFVGVEGTEKQNPFRSKQEAKDSLGVGTQRTELQLFWGRGGEAAASVAPGTAGWTVIVFL